MTRIYVNRAAVSLSRQDGRRRPVVTVRRGDPFCAYAVQIMGPSRVVHDPSQDASVWVETDAEVRAEVDGGVRVVEAEAPT